jgi:hypothetical protein
MKRGLGLLAIVTTVVSGSPTVTAQTTEPLKFVTGRTFIKTTVQECMLLGGEYVGVPGGQRSDMIDCVLPPPIRGLGPGLHTGQRQILGSVYDYLYRSSIEKARYGLYSYLLLPAPGARSEQLLQEVFRTTSYVDLGGISTQQLNILYLPVRAAAVPQLLPIVRYGGAPNAADFASQYYDYSLARSLLSRLCQSPVGSAATLCRTDLSLGPYIVTYPQPASAVDPLPKPYLLVDLSAVPPEAFGELVSAYKQQVQGPDFAGGERVNTLRLRLLNIFLTAADVLKPLLGDPSAAVSIHDGPAVLPGAEGKRR